MAYSSKNLNILYVHNYLAGLRVKDYDLNIHLCHYFEYMRGKDSGKTEHMLSLARAFAAHP